ncbi:unnamed protein product, partial [Darwinula stevensoni]
GPTFGAMGLRVGEEILKKNFFNMETGSLPLTPEIWTAFDASLLSSSSPLHDWGFMLKGRKEKNGVRKSDNHEQIQKILRERGVEWKNEKNPPIPLQTKVGSGAKGVFESLSIAITGSLLYLPLLQKKIGDGDKFSLIHSAARVLLRPIVLICEERIQSRTFLPPVRDRGQVQRNGAGQWKGILLYGQGRGDSINILPVVRFGGYSERNKSSSFYFVAFLPFQDDAGRLVWMAANKLPQPHVGFGDISFQGNVGVEWRAHTTPLLWILDRYLAGLPSLKEAPRCGEKLHAKEEEGNDTTANEEEERALEMD